MIAATKGDRRCASKSNNCSKPFVRIEASGPTNASSAENTSPRCDFGIPLSALGCNNVTSSFIILYDVLLGNWSIAA